MRIETLGRELFQSVNASRSMLARLVTPLLAKIPEAHVRPDGFVEWRPDRLRERTLAESRFVIVDVETTGSSTRSARITEVAAYAVENGAIVDDFTSLVNPLIPIPDYITGITGITNAMVTGAPRFAELAEPLRTFLGDGVVVAHNATFDMGFLRMEFAEWDAAFSLDNPSLCTVHLSRHLVPGLENYKLHTVAEHFGIRIENRHRAGGDALATARIFLHLLERLDAAGVATVAAARKLKRSHRTAAT